jgi:hypothetical protein
VQLIGESVGAGVVSGAEQHDLGGAGVEAGGEVFVDEAVAQWYIRGAGWPEAAE